jgi:hypothetical protein
MKKNKVIYYLYHFLVTHLLCHCLFLVPFAYTQQALAEEANQSQVIDEKAAQSEAERLENLAHENTANANGGLNSSCDGKLNDTLSTYLDRQAYTQAYLDQGLERMTKQRQIADSLNDSLYVAEDIQREADPVITKELEGLTEKANAAKKEMNDTYPKINPAHNKMIVTQAAYQAAQSQCDNSNNNGYCSNQQRQRIAQLGSAASSAASQYHAIKAAYDKARAEYHRLRSLANSKRALINKTIQNVTTKQQSQIISDAISGCSGSGSTKTCELSGTLYEKDKLLTQLANENIGQAAALAKMKSDALFDLELQKEYNGDYRLFESALKVEADSSLNLDDFDKLGVSNPLKTSRIAMMISNIKVLGFSSAAVKDLKCTQHKKSEAGSKSYHLFRAAAATYLLAQVSDTGLYSDTSSCKAVEQYTSDEKNEQIKTLERAANLTQEQLQNVCLSINPTPPIGDYDWTHYGQTESEAAQTISRLTSLKIECDQYLTDLRGPEYAGKPRTREAALEMMQTALSLSIEELATKREKLAIAYANIQKAKAWIKRVQTYIMILLAIAAALMLAAQFLFSLPFGVGVPGGQALMQRAIIIITIIVGIFLMSELARAKAFLKKWQEKLEIAKYFTHLDCNYDQANAEEARILSMAEQAKIEMEEEVQRRKNDIIEQMNSIVNDPLLPAVEPTTEEEATTSLNHPLDPIEFLMNLIPQASAEDEVQVRDPKRLARSLGVAYGSESFRYFLSQKIIHWKGQSNDITKTANLSNKVLKTVHDLADPFIGGDGVDPLEGLEDFEKQGFPVPETRMITIQNAIALMTENIARLNGSLVGVAYQRDQYLLLLNETRKRLNIKDVGLSDNSTIQQSVIGKSCLSSDGQLDIKCDCRAKKTCAQYSYNGPGTYIPPALAKDGDTALDYANETLTGDLQAANISAGSLLVRKNAIRNRLVIQEENLNKTRGQAGLSPRDIAQEASNADRINDQQANTVTTNSNPNDQAKSSPFARARSKLLSNSATKSKKAVDQSLLEKAKQGAKNLVKRLKNSATSTDNSKKVSSESYSFSALEKGSPDGTNASDIALNDQQFESNEEGLTTRYTHQRRSSTNRHKNIDPIHKRNSDLFRIISKRYERTAFPLLLP